MKTIYQFAYKNGTPTMYGPVVDCRKIENPWARAKHDDDRRALVRADPEFNPKVEIACLLLKKSDSVAIGCTHGKHRSGAVAEEVARLTGAKIIIVDRGIML